MWSLIWASEEGELWHGPGRTPLFSQTHLCFWGAFCFCFLSLLLNRKKKKGSYYGHHKPMHKMCISVVYCPPRVCLLKLCEMKNKGATWEGKNVSARPPVALSDSPPPWEWLEMKLHLSFSQPFYSFISFNFLFFFSDHVSKEGREKCFPRCFRK